MITTLYRSAAAWTVVGLASGLFYREFTKANDFTGWTQLSVVHTHSLALGTTVLLVLLGLAAVFGLGTDRRFRWGLGLWNAGLAVTTGAMLVKGTMQVLGNPTADSPAIAGVSGLGHMVLTVAFVLLFLGLGRAVRRHVGPTTARAGADRETAGVAPSRAAEHAPVSSQS